MKRHAMAAAVIGAGLLGISAPAQSGRDPVVSDIRFWSLGDVIRIAIETTSEVQFRAERIENPDRLFFDLIGARRRDGVRGLETLPVGEKLLHQIRIAETQPGTIRVVLDLGGPVEYVASQLSNPNRLMIELRAATPALREAPPTLPAAAVERSAPQAAPVVAQGSQPAAPQKPVVETKPVPPDASAAQRDSRGRRSLIRALGLKLGRVVLDPGHGGHDTGTIGPGGLSEKELVLDVAQRLGALITERLGSEVVYTRTGDTFVPLEVRTDLANEKKADLFLSIHANSSRLRATAGPETYYLNFTTSASALDVAARENATSQKSIHELEGLIQKIFLKERVDESREFAATVQKAIHTALWQNRARDRGVKQAPFVVLIGARMPAILAEIDFLSNPRQERLLKRADFRQRIAEALYQGVAKYASTLSHFQLASKDE
jgi:N-acetylmuramoyl-L-alanine amidase